MKGKHNFYNLRYDDPKRYTKEMQGDIRFYTWFQADWYETLIMTKTNPVTDMNSISWDYLEELDMPVVHQSVSACSRMKLQTIMNFNCDWNEEVVAQFYTTLYVDREAKKFHWSLQGKPFSVGYREFAELLEFEAADLDKPKIHGETVLEDGEMHYIYDRAYGKIEFGKTKRMIPYYKMLN